MCIKSTQNKLDEHKNKKGNQSKRSKIACKFWKRKGENVEYPDQNTKVMSIVIYDLWKKEWMNDGCYDAEKDLFYPLFVETYDFVKEKAEKNKSKNFKWKKRTLLVIGTFFLIIFLINCVADIWVKADTKWLENLPMIGYLVKLHGIRLMLRVIVSFARNIGGFYSTSEQFIFLCALLSAFFFGWINVKKYQETWVRHYRHRYKMDRELFLFTQAMKPYHCKNNRKQIFIENILKIWDGNSVKFEENMKKENPSPLNILQSNSKSD